MVWYLWVFLPPQTTVKTNCFHLHSSIELTKRSVDLPIFNCWNCNQWNTNTFPEIFLLSWLKSYCLSWLMRALELLFYTFRTTSCFYISPRSNLEFCMFSMFAITENHWLKGSSQMEGCSCFLILTNGCCFHTAEACVKPVHSVPATYGRPVESFLWEKRLYNLNSPWAQLPQLPAERTETYFSSLCMCSIFLRCTLGFAARMLGVSVSSVSMFLALCPKWVTTFQSMHTCNLGQTAPLVWRSVFSTVRPECSVLTPCIFEILINFSIKFQLFLRCQFPTGWIYL